MSRAKPITGILEQPTLATRTLHQQLSGNGLGCWHWSHGSYGLEEEAPSGPPNSELYDHFPSFSLSGLWGPPPVSPKKVLLISGKDSSTTLFLKMASRNPWEFVVVGGREKWPWVLKGVLGFCFILTLKKNQNRRKYLLKLVARLQPGIHLASGSKYLFMFTMSFMLTGQLKWKN